MTGVPVREFVVVDYTITTQSDAQVRADNELLDQKIGRLLKFRLLSAKEIVVSALKREESIGVHYIISE